MAIFTSLYAATATMHLDHWYGSVAWSLPFLSSCHCSYVLGSLCLPPHKLPEEQELGRLDNVERIWRSFFSFTNSFIISATPISEDHSVSPIPFTLRKHIRTHVFLKVCSLPPIPMLIRASATPSVIALVFSCWIPYVYLALMIYTATLIPGGR